MRVIFSIGIFLFSFNATAMIGSICADYNHIGKESIPTVPICKLAGDTLYIDGRIDHILLDELIAFESGENIKHIELNSFGGSIRAIERMAQVIRERKISTNVRAGAVCMSACTVVYQAGYKRTAHKDAKFLYHTVRGSDEAFEYHIKLCQENGEDWCDIELENKKEKLRRSTGFFFGLLVNYGADPNLLAEFYKNFPPATDSQKILEEQRMGNYLLRGDWLMTPEEAMKYNVVHEIVD